MKKLTTFLLMLMFSLSLIACQDRKVSDGQLKVSFFTYNNDRINTILNIEVNPGEIVEKPEDPIRVGYEFIGWFKDLGRTEEWDFDVDVMPEHMIVLFAGWREEIYYVYYHVFGAPNTIPNAEYDEVTDTWKRQFKVGDSLPAPTLSGVTGFTFKGWYFYLPFEWTEDAQQSIKPGDKGMQQVVTKEAKDVHVYSHWERRYGGFSFNINWGDNTGPKPYSIQTHRYYYGYTNIYKAEYDLLDNKEEYNVIPDFSDIADTLHYEFIGWNTKADGTGEDVLINGTISTMISSRTAYAQWRRK